MGGCEGAEPESLHEHGSADVHEGHFLKGIGACGYSSEYGIAICKGHEIGHEGMGWIEGR